LRRRRPKAVDRLAISSQSPFGFVGENSPIANQGQAWIPSRGIVSRAEASLTIRGGKGEVSDGGATAAPLVLLAGAAGARIVPPELGSIARRRSSSASVSGSFRVSFMGSHSQATDFAFASRGRRIFGIA
jgi:hypothetical protein